jgi:hypothetical protein
MKPKKKEKKAPRKLQKKEIKKLQKKVDQDALVSVIAPEELLDYIRFAANPWKAFLFGFLRGTAYGLGIVLGTAIVLTILFYISDWFINYPIVGEWLKRVGEAMSIKK